MMSPGPASWMTWPWNLWDHTSHKSGKNREILGLSWCHQRVAQGWDRSLMGLGHFPDLPATHRPCYSCGVQTPFLLLPLVPAFPSKHNHCPQHIYKHKTWIERSNSALKNKIVGICIHPQFSMYLLEADGQALSKYKIHRLIVNPQINAK